jgi:hypothetical protein
MHTVAYAGTPALEAAIARALAAAARRAISAGLASWPRDGSCLQPAWDALMEHPAELQVLRWRDDNQAPFLEAWHLPAPVAARAARGAHPLMLLASPADAHPGMPVSDAELERRLAGLRNRDATVLAALGQGMEKTRISRLSGLSRVTINAIEDRAAGAADGGIPARAELEDERPGEEQHASEAYGGA